jgi:hypothetical protein
MPSKLVTLATFGNPAEAAIARNHLAAEGIRAFLADEDTVAMAWHLGNAIGGIKLQVADDDAERAISILETNDPNPIADDEWRSAGSGEKLSDAETDETDDEDDPLQSPVDEDVARAFRAAIFGFIILPLQLYSLWLLAKIKFSGIPLSATTRRRMVITLLLNLPVVFVCLFLLWTMFQN